MQSNSILGYKPKRDENIHPQKLYTSVHSNIIHTVQNVKTTQPVHGQMKCGMSIQWSTIWHKRKQVLTSCCNKDTLGNMWRKVSHKRPNPCMIAWFHLYEMSRIGKFLEKGTRLVAWGWGEMEEWGDSDYKVLKLIVVMITQFCECTKKHWIIWHVNYISGKLFERLLSESFFQPFTWNVISE